LVGGGLIERIDSVRTIKNFWPYSTTVFDYIRRAMPWPQPRTLSNDEVYALTAYILAENKLIGADEVMNAKTLPQVKMPNRDGFIIRFPGEL
jgi:cytochrome c